MSAIFFDHVDLFLGQRKILSDVTIDIQEGEFIGVLGPNGAGKTTLMRAILGLVPPQNGEIKVFSKSVTHGNPAIGYMAQTRTTAATLRLCGWDFIASSISGHRWGLPFANKNTKKNIEWALDLVGGSSLARRPLSELSGGERQRLLIAQSLVERPKLLLLDEPLMSLDPHHQSAMVDLVKDLRSHLKMTVLFSAHELNPLLKALDRVLYLGQGHAALGTVDEVITPTILSRLYGSPIDVIRLEDRIFVMSGAHEVERNDHRHGCS